MCYAAASGSVAAFPLNAGGRQPAVAAVRVNPLTATLASARPPRVSARHMWLILAALGLSLAVPLAARAQAVEKLGQAEVPILEDNLDSAKTRAIREAQAQAVGRMVAELVAPEWVQLYDKELRRGIFTRVDRYISAFRTQRLEASPDRTRYVAVVAAQVSRAPLVEDLRELGLPILTDPRKGLRILFPANDPVLVQVPLRTAVLGALQPRLELLNFRVSGAAMVDSNSAEWLRDAATDNPRRTDFLAKQRQDAVLFLDFHLAGPGAAQAVSRVNAVLYQGAGGFVLADFDRQSAAAGLKLGDARLRDFLLAELVNPLVLQVQPGAIRTFRPSGSGTRLALRVMGFDSVAEEEAFESAFFRRNSPFANFAIHRIEPDAIVYEGTFAGNREALDRELPGRQVGEFAIQHVTWMDSVLELDLQRTVFPLHQELDLFPVEKRPPQVNEVLQNFFGHATALEVQDPLYAEKEDNGWLERANQLAFNTTIYGQVDSRGDADFYIGEALAEGESLDVIWYRPDRTNLSPVLRVHDGNGHPVRSYFPRAYTRFTYKVPPGQHSFYLEVADRFGFLKSDGSGYQKFHYLLLVKRQSNR